MERESFGGSVYSMDIINTATYTDDEGGPWWHNFHSRVFPWPENCTPTADFLTIQLDEERRFIYEPMAPFPLERDECSSWVSWAPITTICGNKIRALKINTEVIGPGMGVPPSGIARFREARSLSRTQSLSPGVPHGSPQLSLTPRVGFDNNDSFRDLTRDVRHSKDVILREIVTTRSDLLMALRAQNATPVLPANNNNPSTSNSAQLSPQGATFIAGDVMSMSTAISKLQTASRSTWRKIDGVDARVKVLEEGPARKRSASSDREGKMKDAWATFQDAMGGR